MSEIFNFQKGKYQFGNRFELAEVRTDGQESTKAQYDITPVKGVGDQQGDIIKAEDHNVIQQNGYYFQKLCMTHH